MDKARSVTLSALSVMLCACSAGSERVDREVPLARVWELQDRRVNDPAILAACRASDPAVRELAATALGRMPLWKDAAVETGLVERLGDEAPAVRRAAAFALGLRGKGGALVGALEDPDPELRELAASALGRCGEESFVASLLPALSDRVRRVRGAAALALVRLLGDRLRQPQAGSAPARSSAVTALLAAFERERDPDARWCMVYALAHLADPRAEAALLAALASGAREEKVFAARGLSALPVRDPIRAALVAALDDPEAAVVVEAATALASPERQPDPQVRKSAGTLYASTVVSAALLRLASDHALPAVRIAALRLMGRCGNDARFPERGADPAEVAASIDGRARAHRVAQKPGRLAFDATGYAALDWRVRAAWARALADDPTHVETFLGDPDVRVRVALLEPVPEVLPPKEAAQVLRRALPMRDLLLRETLGELAPRVREPSLAKDLEAALLDSPGPEFAEARKLLLQAVVALAPATPATEALLLRCQKDPALVVRRAARLLARGTGPSRGKQDALLELVADTDGDLVTPALGADIPFAFLESRPRIVLETSRGDLEITLRPDQAPVHCWNLVQLVAAGAYDGRILHRVVPNFVVQGGDHRGDGSGARAWHGKTIRDEVNPLPFVTGTLGMPKTADPDTGGDQIFVTTVPAPHLDGRYTVFGLVTDGLALLDAFVVGDRIVKARVVREDS